MVDSYGLPVEFEITGGEVNDCSVAPDLIARLPEVEVIVADKGCDTEKAQFVEGYHRYGLEFV